MMMVVHDRRACLVRYAVKGITEQANGFCAVLVALLYLVERIKNDQLVVLSSAPLNHLVGQLIQR